MFKEQRPTYDHIDALLRLIDDLIGRDDDGTDMDDRAVAGGLRGGGIPSPLLRGAS